MTGNLLLTVVVGLVGACGGSFAATAALRTLRGEQAVAGRSHCDGCGVTLGAAATIPLFSYPALRGACTHCGGRIDPTHLAGEVAGAALGAGAFALLPPAFACLVLCLGLVLLAASIIDQRTQRLPDRLTLVVGLLCLGLALLAGRLLEGLAAAAITFALLEVARQGYLRFRGRSGLGAGDVKLLAALALWLGAATPWAVTAASAGCLALVLIARPSGGKIAFGPFIAGGALAVGLLIDSQLLPALELI